MNKWPKEWIDVLDNPSLYRINGDANKFSYDWVHPQDILDRLHKAGALKDPPKPREIWWCSRCRQNDELPIDGRKCSASSFSLMCSSIKMREVTDES